MTRLTRGSACKQKPRPSRDAAEFISREVPAAKLMLNGASCLFSSPASWRPSWLFSWPASSPSWLVFLRLSFSPVSSWQPSSWRRHHLRQELRAWEQEARVRLRVPVPRLQVPASRVLLPPALLPRNLLLVIRYRRRYRQILPLHHDHRALDRKTSLLLLIQWRPGADTPPWLQARENLKDCKNSFAAMAPDYSTTFGDICKDCRHNQNQANPESLELA